MTEDDSRSLDELLDGERIAMLVTPDQRARPLTILARERDRLWFAVDRTADWVAGLDDGARVTVAVVDRDDGRYVSLTGTAGTTDDRDRVAQLWSPPLRAFFDGADDPDLVALHVDVVEGEYWDGPDSGVARLVRGLAGVVTGEGDRTMGSQGDVRT